MFIREILSDLPSAFSENITPFHETYIHNVRLHLQKIMQHKTKDAILRSKATWHERGERSTRYVLT